MKFYLDNLIQTTDGIDVIIRQTGPHAYGVIKGVCENVLRCLLGEEDRDYLLASDGGEMFRPLTAREFSDLITYSTGGKIFSVPTKFTVDN